MKRAAAFLLAALLSLASLTACNADTASSAASSSGDAQSTADAAGDETSGEEEKTFSGTLRVQLIGDYSMEDFTDGITGEQREGLHVIKEDFESKYPGTTLEFVIMGWDDYVKKTQTMIMANEADVYQVPGISLMADMDVLEPLQPYIDAENYDLSVYIDGQVDGWKIQPEGSDELEIYSLPFNSDTRVTAYDKKIFDEWGVEYLSENPTIEEILEKASRMTGINPVTGEMNYGVMWRGTDAGDLLVNICEGLGGSWGENFRFDELVYHFNSSEMVQAAEYMKELLAYAPEGVMSNAGGENWGKSNNDVAIYLRSGNFLPTAEALGTADQYGVSYTFLNPETGTGSMFCGNPFAIGNTSENKELAWEFLKYVATDTVQSYFWENYYQMPCTKSGLEFEGIKDNENMTLIFNSVSTAWTPRYPYRSASPKEMLSAAIESVCNGSASAQDALDSAQAQAEEWTSQQ